MKLGQFKSDGSEGHWAGVVSDDGIVNLNESGRGAGVELPRDLRSVLGTWNWREKVDLTMAYATETGAGVYARDDVETVAPITDPQKIVCVGLNYADHADEGDQEIPDSPMLFAKFPQSIVGPNEAVTWDPGLTEAVDYEGELVVVIGREARNVSEDEAEEYIAGYTIGNDVSARDLQLADEQWVRGKSLDTFAPLGPYLVTPDEIDDVNDIDVWTEVNGDRLQESSTEHLIFRIDELVSFCSRAFTLSPGDVIFTGTPDGVGYFRDPQVLLSDGDTVTVGIDGLGELTNPCRHTS